MSTRRGHLSNYVLNIDKVVVKKHLLSLWSLTQNQHCHIT